MHIFNMCNSFEKFQTDWLKTMGKEVDGQTEDNAP